MTRYVLLPLLIYLTTMTAAYRSSSFHPAFHVTDHSLHYAQGM